jgi:hypothetical protein
MEKPNARGPSAGRKAHLALGKKLNRKSKKPPALPETITGKKDPEPKVRRH